VDCEQGDVLYLALEDNRRRVKDRLLTLCPAREVLDISLDRLSVRTLAPRIDTGLLAELDKWRLGSKNPRLIIIDVFLKVHPPGKKGEDSYAADYDAVTPLQRYASEHRLAIVLVTHTRKMEAEDPLEAISGTNGVTGAADAVLVLARGSKGVTFTGADAISRKLKLPCASMLAGGRSLGMRTKFANPMNAGRSLQP
jgi:RecA-family ATPase